MEETISENLITGVNDLSDARNMNMDEDDAISGRFVTMENQAGGIGGKEIKLESLMVEVTLMKKLVHEMMHKQETHFQSTNIEMVGLKNFCSSIQASIAALDVIAKSKGTGSLPNCEKESTMKNVEHLDTVNTNLHEVLGENETLNDAAIGASGSNLNNATTAVMPEKSSQQHTLAELLRLKLPGSICVQECMIKPGLHDIDQIDDHEGNPILPNWWTKSNSDFKRSADAMAQQVSPGAGGRHVPKRLFHSPSPTTSISQTPNSSMKGKKKVEGNSSKKPRHDKSVLPKLAKLNFRPTLSMHLAPIEAQACGFLFQKSATFKVKYDPLVKTGEVTATMADLQCLRPPRQISPLIMQLNAERLRFEQEENNGPFVWHLPPSFEDDLLAGTKVQEMTAKYCSKWMPPSPNLKFIYVPLRTIHGHWYLIIVDMEHGVIYHLDSFLTVDFMEVRRRRIRRIADMIHHLVLDPMYSSSFGNKHIDFKNMSITEARGIPNMGCSDNSGVWVLDWGESAHCIDLKNLPGKLNENEVRMTTAAKLMLGKHNDLKAKVEHHTSMFIDSFPSDTPINLDA